MINLFDKGLSNAICCFGTNNVDEDKLAILKMQNIDGVDIIFDGDEAGQRAADNIKGLAERLGLISRNVNLGANIDPGSLASNKIRDLKERLYG